MRPAVSVLMSVYNGALYLPSAIDSIMAQTYSNYEFIVIDDGSLDDTWNILQRYASKDKRIRLIRNLGNIGLSGSLNKGLWTAQGAYIARQDCDDVSLPDRIEKQLAYLENNDGVVMVSCNLYRIDAAGRLMRKDRTDCETELIPWYLLFSNTIRGHSQVMFKRDSAIQAGGYSKEFRYSQDYEFWIRLLKFGRIAIMPNFLHQYRWHENRVSHRSAQEQVRYAAKVSAAYLSEITGEQMDWTDAYRLWCFWTIEPTQSLYFQIPENLKTIHTRLKQIRKKYVDLKLSDHPHKKRLFRKAGDSVGKRYLKWTLFHIYRKARPQAVFWALAYSVSWLKLRFFPVLINVLWSSLENLWTSSAGQRK